MELSIFVGGSAASVPTATRGLSSYLLRAGSKKILIDCGEGTQHQFARSIGLPEIDDIFITHLHLDHWFGLVGILKTFDLRDRERPLRVFGPPFLNYRIKSMTGILGRTGYPLEVIQLSDYDEVPYDDFKVKAFPVQHRTEAFGYSFVEPMRRGRVDVEKVKSLGIVGPDIGRMQANPFLEINGVVWAEITGPPRSGRRVVFSGDTRPCAATEMEAYKADLLIHEATFSQAEAARAKKTGHSTAREAGLLARAAEAKRLVLTHVSARDHWKRLEQEAATVFDGPMQVARDFDTYEIPYVD